MANVAELAIVIRARNEATRAFQQAEREANSLAKSVGNGLKVAGALGAAGMAAAAFAAYSFVKAAAAEQVGIERLQTSIKTLSAAQQAEAKNVEQLVRQREKLAFSDDQIRDSLSLLIAQTGGYTEAVNRQKIAMDITRGTGMDLATSSRLIGKINEETTNTFARYGIVIRQGASEQEALAEIQRRFAGQSESYATTATAKWEIFNNQMDNIKETIGAALLPVVTELGTKLGDFLTRHQASIEKFAQVLAVELPRAFNGIADGAQRAFAIIAPFVSALDTKDAVIALGAVAIAFGAIAVAATVAAIAANAALLGIPIAIAAIVVAITLLVRHWDQVWAALQKAPAALLDWLRKHWVDGLLLTFGPVGVLALIIKNWNAIFELMPRPVQIAMNTVAGFVESGVRQMLLSLAKLVEGLDKISFIGRALGADIPKDLSGDLEAIANSLNFKGQVRGGGSGFFGGLFDKMKDLPGQIDDIAASTLNFGAVLGGGGGIGGGGGAGGAGVTAAIDENVVALQRLAEMYQQWAAATGGTQAQFVARIEMMQRESELNTKIADAQMQAAIETEKATDANYALRIGLKELALQALESGRTMTEVARDAFAQLVDNLRSAFQGLFGRPTREQAELNLRLAKLEEERARKKAAGATEEELEGINRRIERLREDQDLMSKHADVLRAQMEAADQTLITEEQRDFAAQLYIAAMNTQSAQLATLNDLAVMEALARSHLIDAMNNAANSYGASTSAADPFNDAEKHWINGVARGKGEPEPYPGYERGIDYVPRTGLAMLHRGERVVPAAQNGPSVVNNYISTVEIHGDPREGMASLGVNL